MKTNEQGAQNTHGLTDRPEVVEGLPSEAYEAPELYTLGTAVELLKGIWRRYNDGGYTYIFRD